MHLLVIRFSAMGDVAMIAPVFKALLRKTPDLKITFVSRSFFAPLFQFSERLNFVGVNLSHYKGVFGLKNLSKELLKDQSFDAIIDLHDVLRTKIMRTFFKLKGQNVIVFDKGRDEKKAMLTASDFKPLKHATQRYLDAFKKLNLDTEITKEDLLSFPLSEKVSSFLKTIHGKEKIIGVAPYAAHNSKEWGEGKIKPLIQELTKQYTVLLLGGGATEVEKLKQLEQKFEGCFSVAGQFTFREELELISHLNLMISMDSANMHLAAICHTPVVSIWGSTHHFLGFGPLFNEQNIVEVSKDKLPCRPVSIYGKIKSKKDAKCAEKSMQMISVEMVLEKVNIVLE